MKNILKSDAFLLALFPVLAFICAFLFEMGYSDAFGYPYSLIEIDLKSTVVSLFLTVLVLCPVLFVFVVFFRFGFSDSTPGRIFALPLVGFIVSLIFSCISGFQEKILNWILLFCLLYAISRYLEFAFQVHRFGWSAAVSSTAKRYGIKPRRNEPSTNEPLDLENLIKLYLFLLGALIVLGLMIRGVGVAAANWRNSYQVIIIEKNEYAVLSVYGDLFVLGGVYDDQFDKQIVTVSKSADKPREFRRAHFPDFLSRL